MALLQLTPLIYIVSVADSIIIKTEVYSQEYISEMPVLVINKEIDKAVRELRLPDNKGYYRFDDFHKNARKIVYLGDYLFKFELMNQCFLYDGDMKKILTDMKCN
jgi:hypothetical protein